MKPATALASGALLMVGACSQEQAAAPPPEPETTSEVRQAPAPTEGTATVTSAPSAGALRGTVSSLSGAISELNTRITDLGLAIDLPADALFEFDKAELTSAAEAELRKAAELIRKSPPGPIQVIGHTDSKGDDAYNQKLSEERARSVADWFGTQVGVRQRMFEVAGKGETQPIAPNETASGQDDPVGRARNRRVEVIVPRA